MFHLSTLLRLARYKLTILIASALVLLFMVSVTSFFLQYAPSTGARSIGPYPTLPVTRGQSAGPARAQEVTYASLFSQSKQHPNIRVASWSAQLDTASVNASSSALVHLLQPTPSVELYEHLKRILFGENDTYTTSNSADRWMVVLQQPDSALLYMNKQDGSFLYQTATPAAQLDTSIAQPDAVNALIEQLLPSQLLQLSTIETQQDTTRYTYARAESSAVGRTAGQPWSLVGGYETNTDVASESAQMEHIVSSDGTVRVIVQDDGVVSIVSTLRLLNTDKKAVSLKLQTPAQALEKIRRGIHTNTFVLPSMSMSLSELGRLYANSTISLSRVTLTRGEFRYLHELPGVSQVALSPQYVFWGTGVLPSGHEARVLVTSAAVATSETGAGHDGSSSLQKLAQVAMIRGKAYSQQQSTILFDQVRQLVDTRASGRSVSQVAGLSDNPGTKSVRNAFVSCPSTRGITPLVFTRSDTGVLLGLFVAADQSLRWYVLPAAATVDQIAHTIDSSARTLRQSPTAQTLIDIVNKAESTPLPCPTAL